MGESFEEKLIEFVVACHDLNNNSSVSLFNHVHFVRNWEFSRNKFWDDLPLIRLLVDIDFNPPCTHKIRRYVYYRTFVLQLHITRFQPTTNFFFSFLVQQSVLNSGRRTISHNELIRCKTAGDRLLPQFE